MGAGDGEDEVRTVEEPVERLRRYLNERGPGGEEFRSFVAEAWPDLLGYLRPGLLWVHRAAAPGR